MTCPKERGRADGVKVFGGGGWRSSVSCPRPTGIQCWIDEGRVGRVGTVLVECSEVLRIVNFRTYFFLRFLMY